MSGGLRTLYSKQIQKAIKFQVLDPLEADLFMFVGTDKRLVSQGLFESEEAMAEGFRQIQETLAPLSVETYDVDDIPRPPHETWGEVAPCWTWNLRGKATRPPRNMWPQFWGIQRCFQMVQAEERRRGRLYDWVIRMRPDVIFSPLSHIESVRLSLPPVTQPPLQLREVWGQAYYREILFCDHFQMVPRGAADVHFSVERAFRFCNASTGWQQACGDQSMDFATECLWHKHLLDGGVTVNKGRKFNIQVTGYKWDGNSQTLQNTLKVRRVCPWK